MKRYNVRPSKYSSATGFIACIGMSIIGVVLFFVTIASGFWIGSVFLVMWTGIAVSAAIYNARNAFGKKGVPLEHIEYEDTSIDSLDSELRKLKKLADDGIITEDEFQHKKKEILRKEG